MKYKSNLLNVHTNITLEDMNTSTYKKDACTYTSHIILKMTSLLRSQAETINGKRGLVLVSAYIMDLEEELSHKFNNQLKWYGTKNEGWHLTNL